MSQILFHPTYPYATHPTQASPSFLFKQLPCVFVSWEMMAICCHGLKNSSHYPGLWMSLVSLFPNVPQTLACER